MTSGTTLAPSPLAAATRFFEPPPRDQGYLAAVGHPALDQAGAGPPA